MLQPTCNLSCYGVVTQADQVSKIRYKKLQDVHEAWLKYFVLNLPKFYFVRRRQSNS